MIYSIWLDEDGFCWYKIKEQVQFLQSVITKLVSNREFSMTKNVFLLILVSTECRNLTFSVAPVCSVQHKSMTITICCRIDQLCLEQMFEDAVLLSRI